MHETAGRLRSAIIRAIAYYIDRFTLRRIFTSTRSEKLATLPALVSIANDESADAAVLLFAYASAGRCSARAERGAQGLARLAARDLR